MGRVIQSEPTKDEQIAALKHELKVQENLNRFVAREYEMNKYGASQMNTSNMGNLFTEDF